MSSTTDMNIVLGQGNAIKEVHNVRREHLELNQQFVAQKSDDKRKEDRSKVQESEAGNRIEIKDDEEEKKRKGARDSQKGSKMTKTEEESNSLEGSLIDITV